MSLPIPIRIIATIFTLPTGVVHASLPSHLKPIPVEEPVPAEPGYILPTVWGLYYGEWVLYYSVGPIL